jgi:hypothetical protein
VHRPCTLCAEPALDAVESERAKLLSVGNILMKILLTLIVPILGALGVFFPRLASTIATILWFLFLLVQLVESSTSKNGLKNDPSFTEAEKTILSQYAFFFKRPFAACGISDAGPLWIVASIPWAIILSYNELWLFMACPVFVFGTVFYLAPRLNPIQYLSEQAKRTPIVYPEPSPAAFKFLAFVEVCEKFFPKHHSYLKHLNELNRLIWPHSPLLVSREKSSLPEASMPIAFEETGKIWKKLTAQEVEILDKHILNNNILGIAEMLLKTLKKHHLAIRNAIDDNFYDQDDALRGSVHLIQLSNRISYKFSSINGSISDDLSSDDLASAKNTQDLARLAYLRFWSAITLLQLLANDDLAEIIKGKTSQFMPV